MMIRYSESSRRVSNMEAVFNFPKLLVTDSSLLSSDLATSLPPCRQVLRLL
ncbi:hypothetical protein GBA52_024870 [Prunus armeniaca]|nr:hypothetical protein GBA52_024870 [Prunus armeniaca]